MSLYFFFFFNKKEKKYLLQYFFFMNPQYLINHVLLTTEINYAMACLRQYMDCDENLQNTWIDYGTQKTSSSLNGLHQVVDLWHQLRKLFAGDYSMLQCVSNCRSLGLDNTTTFYLYSFPCFIVECLLLNKAKNSIKYKISSIETPTVKQHGIMTSEFISHTSTKLINCFYVSN